MDLDILREAFPITKVKISTPTGLQPLIYFDHGASTHAPKSVLDSYIKVQTEYYSNVHRGMHALSCIATDALDEVPGKINDFLGLPRHESGMQSVLTYNTTSSLDLASHVFSKVSGDVLTTLIEHHSNDLPHRTRGVVHHAGVLEDGTIDLDDLEDKLQKENIKLLAVSGASNVTGYLPPIEKLARLAHDNGAKILVDGAQRVAHKRVQINDLEHPEHIDFFAAAGHKMYAPFGSAFLLGNTEDFDAADPYIPGGGTVKLVTSKEAIYEKGPERHSYGTPNIAGAIALGAAFDFLGSVGIEALEKHEKHLLEKAEKGLRGIDGVQVLGDVPLSQKIGVITFNVRDYYHADVSQKLNDEAAIATRNGCFCAHPYLIELLGMKSEDTARFKAAINAGEDPDLPGAVRVTIGIYNNEEEVERLLDVVEQIATRGLD